LVERQNAADQMEIADLSLRLSEIRRRIEESAALEAAERLATAPSGPEDMARIEGLLATALVPAGLRAPLRDALANAAGPVGLEAPPFDPRRRASPSPIVTHRQRRCISQQIELELLLAGLAEIAGESASGPPSRLAPLAHQAQLVRRCERQRTEHPESAEQRT